MVFLCALFSYCFRGTTHAARSMLKGNLYAKFFFLPAVRVHNFGIVAACVEKPHN